MQSRASLISMTNGRKVSCDNISNFRGEDHGEIDYQLIESNELRNSKQSGEEFQSSIHNLRRSSRLINKRREAGGRYMPGVQHRNLSCGACPREFSSTKVKPPERDPFSRFSIRSTKGINLFVDLNSSPLDLHKKMINEIFSCQNNSPICIRQEVERLKSKSKQMKSLNIGMDNSDVQTESSSNSIKRKDGHMGCDKQDGDDKSLGICAVITCCDVIKDLYYDASQPQQMIVTSPCCVQEKQNPLNGSEASDPLVKRSEDSVADGMKKRSKYSGIASCALHGGRVLRSAKLPRRSMRLVSK